jgi:dTDP-4-amino-4,6-dideoxygalactose transaminase
MIAPIHCGEPGRSPIDLIGDWMAGGGNANHVSLPGRAVAFTQLGRDAIALAMRCWRIERGAEVLVPAYNCGSEISPIIAAGATPVMYRIDEYAKIDHDDLRRKITARTKIVYVTHYFGRRADIDGISEQCEKYGIKLLEDCALSLFTADTGGRGDAAIFSLRKTLPVADGGILVIRAKNAVLPPPLPAASIAKTARGAAVMLARWGRAKLNRTAIMTKTGSDEALPDMPPSYYYAQDKKIRAASRLARGIAVRIDKHAVVAQRRANYDALRHGLAGLSAVAPLWRNAALPEGECPLGLPIIVDNKNLWVEKLNAAGVAVSPWWSGFHRHLPWQDFPEAIRLKQRLILLPVHQDLTIDAIDRIAAAVRQIANRL